MRREYRPTLTTDASKERPLLGKGRRFYKTADGRIISEGARIAAAQARIVADRKRGLDTEQWIVDLANSKRTS